MRVSLEGAFDGDVNMARDSLLLAKAENGVPGARIYCWSGVWVTLGRFQKPAEAVQSGIPYTLRPTGGNAVLHGHDLTIALAVPVSREQRVGLKLIYRRMTAPILRALHALGVEVTLGEQVGVPGKGSFGADCFASTSANDIIFRETGEKICGCALRITDRAALLQVSIPVGAPLIDPALAIPGAVASCHLSLSEDSLRTELLQSIEAMDSEERAAGV